MRTMDEDVEETIRAFILDDVLEGSQMQIAPDQPLFGGVLDSMALVQLVDFLEERYHFRIDASELVDENFGSLRLLAAYVLSKRAASA
jgi:acyl carrier protein